MATPHFSNTYLKSLELLKLRMRRTFSGSRHGAHLSPRKGHGIEFADYREYEVGDNPRHIDWGVYARSERLYVRQFREDRDLSVLFLLDSSASMSKAKWEMARDIALSLVYITLMDGDKVGVSTLGKSFTPFSSSPSLFSKLCKDLDNISPGSNIDLEKEIEKAAYQLKFPGKVFFISDMFIEFEQFENITNILRAKNFDLSFLCLTDDQDLNPLNSSTFGEIVDSETEEKITVELNKAEILTLAQEIEEHYLKMQDFCVSSQIQFCKINIKEDLLTIMTSTLPKLRVLV